MYGTESMRVEILNYYLYGNIYNPEHDRYAIMELKQERDTLNQTVDEMRKEIEEMRIKLSDKKSEEEKEFNSKVSKVKDNPTVRNANARVHMEMNRILHRICMDDIAYQGAYHTYRQSVEDAYEQLK